MQGAADSQTDGHRAAADFVVVWGRKTSPVSRYREGKGVVEWHRHFFSALPPFLASPMALLHCHHVSNFFRPASFPFRGYLREGERIHCTNPSLASDEPDASLLFFFRRVAVLCAPLFDPSPAATAASHALSSPLAVVRAPPGKGGRVRTMRSVAAMGMALLSPCFPLLPLFHLVGAAVPP